MSSKKQVDEAAASGAAVEGKEAPEGAAQLAMPEAAPVAASEGKKAPAAKKETETPQEATGGAPLPAFAGTGPLGWVKVRFTGELGILAGRAVHGGEVHRVRYWQYLRARETGGEAYQLVEG